MSGKLSCLYTTTYSVVHEFPHVIFILFFVYYPEEEKVLVVRSSGDDLSSVSYLPETMEAPGWTWSKRILMITLTTMSLILITAFLIQSIFGFPSSVSLKFTNYLGFLSLLLSFFQFIPQIFKTYRLQEVGALSITAMLMQTPGSFLMCYTIAISPETTVYTWITYFVGGCLQGCLLLLCIQLKYDSPRRRRIAHYERLESQGDE